MKEGMFHSTHFSTHEHIRTIALIMKISNICIKNRILSDEDLYNIKKRTIIKGLVLKILCWYCHEQPRYETILGYLNFLNFCFELFADYTISWRRSRNRNWPKIGRKITPPIAKEGKNSSRNFTHVFRNLQSLLNQQVDVKWAS